MLYRVLVGLIAFIVVAVSSFAFGVRYESGQNAKKEKATITAAVGQVKTDLKDVQDKAVKAAQMEAEKRYKAREAQRELAKLPARTECDWNADEQRLLDKLYQSYFDAGGNGHLVQDQVRQPAGTE